LTIDDGEARAQADPLGVQAQHARRERMKGAEPPALDRPAQQAGDPVAHLLRRLVGESDGQDLTGVGPAGKEQVGETSGQHPGLAGAGAGEDQDRPVERFHRLALGGVEVGEIGHVPIACRRQSFGARILNRSRHARARYSTIIASR
jgi:hypothetical protein